MNQLEPLAWRERLLRHIEQACQDPHSGLHQLAQEFVESMHDQQVREQHIKQILEDVQATFKTRLMAGAYDQQLLEAVDAQMSDLLRTKHNLLTFGRYIEAQRSVLLGYARTLTTPAQAEDLLGRACVAACNAFDKHPRLDIENLDAWFHRVLDNTNKNTHREATAQKRGTAESLEVLEEEISFEVEDDEDDRPETVLLRSESQETVAELILQLPFPYRRTMTLLLLHDWSARQIADHYQLSAETVKSHIRRSLPLLRIAFLDRHPALKSELDAYILTLPPASQQAMKLFLILGANYQKIAQQLGSPHTPETVKACIEQQRPSLFQLLLTQAS